MSSVEEMEFEIIEDDKTRNLSRLARTQKFFHSVNMPGISRNLATLNSTKVRMAVCTSQVGR